MPFIIGGVEALREHEKAIPIAHPDRSITHPKLEYPTTDVNFTYLAIIGKARGMEGWRADPGCSEFLTTDIFANKAIESLSHGTFSWILARRQATPGNHYEIYQAHGNATTDFCLGKRIGGNGISLGMEAVDFGLHASFRVKIRCIGTTIEGYRVDMITPKISATDTTYANGQFGFSQATDHEDFLLPEWTYLRGSPSNPPKTIAYFEAPITGSGTEEDPYRAKLPEKIIEDKTLGRRNLLSVSHSSLIPTDTKGQPRNTTALVRVFDQPDRDLILDPIDTCLKEIEASTGVKKLTRTDVIKRAKGMDPKLSDYDLLFHPKPTKGDIEGFIKHREKTFEIKLTEEEAIKELKYDKAW